MSLDELRACPREIVHAADVAGVMGVNPQCIRIHARRDPSYMGGSAYVSGRKGTRVNIRRKLFLAWWDGKR